MVEFLLNAAPWIGLTLAAVGLCCVVWALAPRYRRSRRRCPKCWYDMSGTPESLRCTECGRTARSERRLQRSRKRWRMTLVALLIIVIGGAAATTPDVVRGTWARLLPTSILYALEPVGSAHTSAELFRRMMQRPGWPSRRVPSVWMGWPLAIESPVMRALTRHTIAHGPPARVPIALEWLARANPGPSDIPTMERYVRTGPPECAFAALSVLGAIGPDAASAIPLILDRLEHAHTTGDCPLAELSALAAMGPAAAPAVEHLRMLLSTPALESATGTHTNAVSFGGRHQITVLSRDRIADRLAILSAIAAIGPPAAAAAPEVHRLAEDEPHLEGGTACTLASIAPDAPTTFDRALRVLLSDEATHREGVAAVLETDDCSALRAVLIERLTTMAQSSDGCIRRIAVRGLASLDAIAPASLASFVADPDVGVRLVAARWAGTAHLPRTLRNEIRARAADENDPLVLRLLGVGTDDDLKGSSPSPSIVQTLHDRGWVLEPSVHSPEAAHRATSADGRFRLIAKAIVTDTDNPLGPTTRYECTLIDRSTGDVVWTRYIGVQIPICMWVGSDSATVILTQRNDFVVLAAVSGAPVMTPSVYAIFPEEDYDRSHPNRIEGIWTGARWAREASTLFFSQRGSACFAMRTRWDRVVVLDMARGSATTRPDARVRDRIDIAERRWALDAIREAAANPRAVTSRKLNILATELRVALNLAGTLQLREAIPGIRVLESVEPMTSAPVEEVPIDQLRWIMRAHPFELRQLTRTALYRLGEVPAVLPVMYLTDEEWGPVTARVQVPPDRAERIASLPRVFTKDALLQKLGLPECMPNGSCWQYEIVENGAVWILQAEFNDRTNNGTWARRADNTALLLDPAARMKR